MYLSLTEWKSDANTRNKIADIFLERILRSSLTLTIIIDINICIILNLWCYSHIHHFSLHRHEIKFLEVFCTFTWLKSLNLFGRETEQKSSHPLIYSSYTLMGLWLDQSGPGKVVKFSYGNGGNPTIWSITADSWRVH